MPEFNKKTLWEIEVVNRDCDVMVIGAGLAGTFAAIKAKQTGAGKVILLDKGKVGKSGISLFAAGVMHGAFPEDDQEAWFKTVTEQGDYLNDQEWMEICLTEFYDRVVEMDVWGVQFEKTADGKFERKIMRGGTAANPVRGVMFHGPQMLEAMIKKVRASGVEIVNRVMITDYLISDGRVGGAVGFDTITGDFVIFKSKAVISTAGACTYKNTFLDHKFATGDSDAMVYRAGGEIILYEFINHNTSASEFDTVGMNMFIALGGKFVNADGERFLPLYDPEYRDNTLMNRWAGAMALEVKAGRGPIYLDMTHFKPEEVRKLRTVVPMVMRLYDRAGAVVDDRFIRKLPWVVVQKGSTGAGGGARVDTRCATTLQGLYAGGDAAGKIAGGTEGYGVSALSWAAVSGARAGKFSAEYARDCGEPRINAEQVEELKKFAFEPSGRKNGFSADHIILNVQEAMFPMDVHIIMHEDRLRKSLAEVERVREEEVPFLWAADPHYLRIANEARSIVTCTEMYLRTNIERKESRGTTIREDYPFTDNINWLKWIVLKKDNDKMKLWTEDVPIEKYRIKPEKDKKLHFIWEAAKKRGIVKGIEEGVIKWA